MSIVEDWRERHGRKGGRLRLVIYVLLLVFVILLILNAERMVTGFTEIFLAPADSVEVR